MPELIRDRTVTARKAHPCQTCNRAAAVRGETYLRSTYVFDGRIYDWVMCQECSEMLSEVYDWSVDGYEFGVGRYEFHEWAQEHEEFGTANQQGMAKRYLDRLKPPGRCHDCSCHSAPPCSACVDCRHDDHSYCPNDCQTCEDHPYE